MTENFLAKDVAWRIQKKILSRMSNKTVAKVLIDDTSSQLLDDIYRLAKTKRGCTKKDAEKFVKNIIKLVVKAGLAYRNNQFSEAELTSAHKLQQRVFALVMSVVSFCEVEFSYDRRYILSEMHNCKILLQQILQRHVTPKNLARVDAVCSFIGDAAFLDTIFNRNWEHRHLLEKIVDDINKMVDEGTIG